MRTSIVILGVLFAVTLGMPTADEPSEVAAAKVFIECIRKVLVGGLPEANIPDHDPLRFRHNLSLPLDLVLVQGEFDLNNWIIRDIPKFNFTNIESVPENNPNGVYFNYDIWWDWMIFEGDWALKIDDLIDQQGTAKITLNGVVFSGHWNMTLPAGDRPENLDSMLTIISAESTDVNITGSVLDPILNLSGPLVNLVANNLPSELLSGAIQKRLNELWIQNGTRIDTVMEACSLTP